MNLSKEYAEELIKEYADNNPDFIGAEGIDNKFSIWNYTFLAALLSPAVIVLVGTEKMVVLSVSPRNLKVKKVDHVLKTDILSMKAKTGILTHKVKIKTKDKRKFDFELYKTVAGESQWQKKAFDRIQTFVPCQ